MKIIGLAGSLRKRSYNRALLEAAATLMPNRTTLEVHGIEGIPVYDGDLEEASGIPEAVERLKDAVRAGSGLLVATPEYNNAMPGPLKNAIDWMTRPPKDIASVFGGRPVGVIGATPGGAGTRLSQTSWLPVWRTLKAKPFFGDSLYVARAGQLFDDQLQLVDDDTSNRLRRYLEGLVEFCRQSS
jgi:NAD(P)H-dependent FMN reductase